MAHDSAVSDLHIKNGQKIAYRKNGQLIFRDEILDENTLENFIRAQLNNEQLEIFSKTGAIDIGYNIEEIRTRINLYREYTGLAMALRYIKKAIPTPDELLIPYVIQEEVLKTEHGLILICGPTGSGKTTTLASLIESINTQKSKKIITIEDPIEYVFEDKKSIISQREIGMHCDTFANGLFAALRQDPDIILLGEMRDRATISTAIKAAETGHLVLSTLHCSDTAEAVDRIVQYFPEGEKEQIRNTLASSFRLIAAQKLLKRSGGGRVAAFEVIRNTQAIANIIRMDQLYQIGSYMRNEGMQTFADSINELKLRKFI